MLHTHPSNRLVGEIAVKDVVAVAKIGLDRFRVLVQRRVPLVAVTAEEAVEMFETQSVRP
jgi:hypothetical protein